MEAITVKDAEAQVAALTKQLERDALLVQNATEALRDAERQRDRTKRALEAWQASLKALSAAGVP